MKVISSCIPSRLKYIFLPLLALSAGAWADEKAPAPKLSVSEKAALTIGEVTLEEITDKSGEPEIRDIDAILARTAEDRFRNLSKNAEERDDGFTTFDKIYNVGAKIWKVVESGKPVATVDLQSGSAMPGGITDWKAMTGWQEPVVQSFRYTAKNLYGVKVVEFTYRLLYIYGGSINGKGRYLARVAVLPEQIDVAWGYDLDAKASIPSVINVGTVANPIAGAELLVSWKVKTVLKSQELSHSYFVRGDGGFKRLQ